MAALSSEYFDFREMVAFESFQKDQVHVTEAAVEIFHNRFTSVPYKGDIRRTDQKGVRSGLSKPPGILAFLIHLESFMRMLGTSHFESFVPKVSDQFFQKRCFSGIGVADNGEDVCFHGIDSAPHLRLTSSVTPFNAQQKKKVNRLQVENQFEEATVVNRFHLWYESMNNKFGTIQIKGESGETNGKYRADRHAGRR